MNPVMVDWLTLVFAPIGVILLVAAIVTARSASKAKRPTPPSSKVLQGIGIACVLVVAVLQLLGGS